MRIIIATLAALILSGCYTKNQAIKKFCRQDTTNYHYKDTIRDTVIIKGNTAELNLDCEKFKNKYDSLVKVNSNLLDSEGFYNIYEDSNTTIKAKPNKDGSTKFKSKTKDKKKVIEKPIDVILKVPCNCPPCPKLPWYKQFAADCWWALPLIVLCTIIISLFRKWLNLQ